MSKAPSVHKVTVEDQSNVEVAYGTEQTELLDSADYFKKEYEERLAQLAKNLLVDRPGITLHSLALEIANLHGLKKTSRKQIDHLEQLVRPFAGIKRNEDYSPTLWISPDRIVDLIDWRGIEPFGFERKWSELAYEEALGLAKFALKKDADSAVDIMCEELGIKRRHETTVKQFNLWIEEYKKLQPQLA